MVFGSELCNYQFGQCADETVYTPFSFSSNGDTASEMRDLVKTLIGQRSD